MINKSIELQEMARVGMNQIETSIIELLKRNPTGLSNQDIANELGLQSSHEGNQKNYLTYSILGNLMEAGLVFKDKSGPRPKYKVID